MLVSSVCAPAVFSKHELESETTFSLARDRVRHMAFCHINICDQEGRLYRRLLDNAKVMSPELLKLLECVVVAYSQRLVRLPLSHPVDGDLAALLASEPETATVVALAGHPGVDIGIVSAEGKVAIELSGVPKGNLVTLSEYGASPAGEREVRSMGGISLGTMRQERFLSDIIEPVVKWSQKVTIFDKMLCRACFDRDTLAPGRSNWDDFKRTLQAIYARWDSCCLVKRDAFEVVSAPPPASWWGTRIPLSHDEQARGLLDSLELGSCAKARLVKTWGDDVDEDIREAAHDRYLVSNRDVVLNFSRGLDLIGPDGALRQCTVCLCQRQTPDPVSRLLSARTLVSCRSRTTAA